jgi:hypothetical protein
VPVPGTGKEDDPELAVKAQVVSPEPIDEFDLPAVKFFKVFITL